MPNPVPESELIGKTFGKLTIRGFLPSTRSGGQLKRIVVAVCDCGKVKEFMLASLTRGLTKSCGCYRLQQLSINKHKHGLINTDIYKVYCGMKRRCYNPNEVSYKYYGGKGVIVCKEWLEDFTVFYNWAIANGYAKGLQIDRKENSGNYEPGNCSWVTSLKNGRNRSITKIIEYNGERRSAGEWAEITGVNYGTLISRINRGKMSIGDALIPAKPKA